MNFGYSKQFYRTASKLFINNKQQSLLYSSVNSLNIKNIFSSSVFVSTLLLSSGSTHTTSTCKSLVNFPIKSGEANVDLMEMNNNALSSCLSLFSFANSSTFSNLIKGNFSIFLNKLIMQKMKEVPGGGHSR